MDRYFPLSEPDVISHVKCPNRWENDPFPLHVMDIDCFLFKKWKVNASAESTEQILLRSETHFQLLRFGNKSPAKIFVRPLQVKSRYSSN